tara:strand:+ start:445 stop:1086 length:642 start_codon:yes stop_codon:yes gene_type:complete
MVFLWNGVWSRDRTGLPMKEVKYKFIQKNRDILPALCNDTLYLIGKGVRRIREGRDRAYHEHQYRIYRGLEEMPFNCVEHGAVVLHKKVWMHGRTRNHIHFQRLRKFCDTHEDNWHFAGGQKQYVAHVTDLITRQKRAKFYTMPDWEWAGKSDFQWHLSSGQLECSVCGVRGHTKDNCKGCFRSPPQDPYYSTKRLQVLSLEEGNLEWGSGIA